MKLKTKFQDEDFDLGEVVEANIYYGGNGRIKVIVEPAKGGIVTFYFESLKGLNEMFEDAPEKPKGYWFIDAYGNIVQNEITKHYGDEYTDMTDAYESQKQIGNHFETREEAEKAVEKLKAWKRLKDKGLEVTEWSHGLYLDETIVGRFRYEFPIDNKDDIEKDLDLLFGGEE